MRSAYRSVHVLLPIAGQRRAASSMKRLKIRQTLETIELITLYGLFQQVY